MAKQFDLSKLAQTGQMVESVSDKRVSVNLSMMKSEAKKLKQLALDRDMTVSRLVISLVNQELGDR